MESHRLASLTWRFWKESIAGISLVVVVMMAVGMLALRRHAPPHAAAEDRQEPGQIVGVVGHGALGA
jgi:hypothetical protein